MPLNQEHRKFRTHLKTVTFNAVHCNKTLITIKQVSIKMQINEEVWVIKIVKGVINMLQNKSTLSVSNAVGWN